MNRYTDVTNPEEKTNFEKLLSFYTFANIIFNIDNEVFDSKKKDV